MTDGTIAESLRKNEAARRYEYWRDDRLASIVEYDDAHDVVVLPHAETARSMRGHGYAAKVVEFALDDIRQMGRKVDPVCHFVAEHIAHHVDRYADIVSDDPHAQYCRVERSLE